MSDGPYDVDTHRMREVAENYAQKADRLKEALTQINTLVERGVEAMGTDKSALPAITTYRDGGEQLAAGVQSLIDGVDVADGGLKRAAYNFEIADDSARESVAKLAAVLDPGEHPPAR